MLLSAAAAQAQESATTALAADAKAVSGGLGGPDKYGEHRDRRDAHWQRPSYDDNYDPVADFVSPGRGLGSTPDGARRPRSAITSGCSSSPLFLDGEGELEFNGMRPVDFTRQRQRRRRPTSGQAALLRRPAVWQPTWTGSDSSSSWTRTTYAGLDDHSVYTAGPGYINGGGPKGSGPGNPQNPGSIVLLTDNNLSPGQDYRAPRAGVEGQLPGLRDLRT